MDYARFNYVAQPGDKERGVKLTPPRFGEYDKYLIKWTYTPVFNVNSAEEEAIITGKWITDALKKIQCTDMENNKYMELLIPVHKRKILVTTL